MRLVKLANLKGDEILGKRLYDDIGRTLLAEGVKLTSFYVERLKLKGVESVYIDDEISKAVVLEEHLSEKTRQMSKSVVKDMMEKYSNEGKFHNEGVVKSVNSIIDECFTNKDVMIDVSDIRSKDENLYSHSVNVCVLSTTIGIHMDYNMIKLKEIATGALLHDIGKARILSDKKILEEKKTKNELDEYIGKMHPKVGYDFMGAQNTFSPFSKVAVLMHHENIDGSGYPLGLKGNDINEVGRLVSICNVFDNMVSNHSNSLPKPVYEVLEYLSGMSGFLFDGNIVNKLMANIAAFPTGSGVILNTHEKCMVVKQNKSLPLRPVVRVIFDREGKIHPEPFDIDLNKELTIFITEACELIL